MVAAIGFWMKAFGLCNDKWELSEVAHYGSVIILGDLTICHKSVSLRYATQTSRL